MILGHATIQPSQTGHAAGRKLLQKLFEEHIAQPLPQIAVEERGKPYFLNSRWHFSISHTKNHVFCVLSESSVGIDAEEKDRQIDLRLAGGAV